MDSLFIITNFDIRVVLMVERLWSFETTASNKSGIFSFRRERFDVIWWLSTVFINTPSNIKWAVSSCFDRLFKNGFWSYFWPWFWHISVRNTPHILVLVYITIFLAWIYKNQNLIPEDLTFKNWLLAWINQCFRQWVINFISFLLCDLCLDLLLDGFLVRDYKQIMVRNSYLLFFVESDFLNCSCQNISNQRPLQEYNQSTLTGFNHSGQQWEELWRRRHHDHSGPSGHNSNFLTCFFSTGIQKEPRSHICLKRPLTLTSGRTERRWGSWWGRSGQMVWFYSQLL